MALEGILEEICSLKKLDRDKGIQSLRALVDVSTEREELFKRAESRLLAVLRKNERWESTHGCLTAACALVQHATQQFGEVDPVAFTA